MAEAGLVGLALGNAPASMPAWGGMRPLFGTNLIAAAFPRQGRAIPLGWALDADGQSTTDPKAGLAGSMVPAGGVKGTLLSMVIDLLVATLTGSHFGFEADSLLDDDGRPPRVGQVFLLIDPDALAGRETYFARIESLVEVMLQDDNVRLPGAQRPTRQQAAQREGLDIPDGLWQRLRPLADQAPAA